MIINMIVVSISQCICMSKYHIVQPKYMQFLFGNPTTIKLGENPLKVEKKDEHFLFSKLNIMRKLCIIPAIIFYTFIIYSDDALIIHYHF